MNHTAKQECGGPCSPPPFPAVLTGLPIIATASFCGGECQHICVEGIVNGPSVGAEISRSTEPSAERDTSSDLYQKDSGQLPLNNKLISECAAKAEERAVKFLAAAAKASNGSAEEDPDTAQNDEVGLREDY